MNNNFENAVEKVSLGLIVVPLILCVCFCAVLLFIVDGWFLKTAVALGCLSISLIKTD